jgi:hypothetical protein
MECPMMSIICRPSQVASGGVDLTPSLPFFFSFLILVHGSISKGFL